MAYHDTYHMPISITRCSNNYGPYHFPEKLIPLIINNILEGKKLPVYGEGLNVRDWLYVEDHCKAIDMVVREGREGEVYNVGAQNIRKSIMARRSEAQPIIFIMDLVVSGLLFVFLLLLFLRWDSLEIWYKQTLSQ